MASFDWKSLIPSAAALGSKVAGDKLAPSPDLMGAQTSQQNAQFNQQLALMKAKQQSQMRSAALPGMYSNLGYTPEQGQAAASQYGQTPMPTAAGGSGGSGGGGSIGKTIAGLGASIAPAALGAIHGTAPFVGPTLAQAGLGGAAASGGAAGGAGGAGLGSTIAGLATNPFTIAAAGALVGGLLWRKSQAHPEANQWVQGEQNPFDQSMRGIDQSIQSGQISPEQAAQTKQQNAQNYLHELQQFGAKGGDHMIVAKQAANTFRQYYGDPANYGVQLGF